jgi:hypothetical protein
MPSNDPVSDRLRVPERLPVTMTGEAVRALQGVRQPVGCETLRES